jgi:hypothetical protein
LPPKQKAAPQKHGQNRKRRSQAISTPCLSSERRSGSLQERHTGKTRRDDAANRPTQKNRRKISTVSKICTRPETNNAREHRRNKAGCRSGITSSYPWTIPNGRRRMGDCPRCGDDG